MVDVNFAGCYADTLVFEGGYSDNPNDPGGSTDRGITQTTYDAYRRTIGAFTRDVRDMTDTECRAIYRTYWDAVRGDELWDGLDLLQYDECVNSGSAEAVRLMQQTLGIEADGFFGLETLAAVNAVVDKPAFIKDLCARRLSFWRSLSTWQFFKGGWTTRDYGMEAKALALCATSKGAGSLSAAPVPAPAQPPNPSYADGSTEWLQASLNALGAAPPLSVDGDYGAATTRAVVAFQQATKGLWIDGAAGPKTKAAIKAALAAKS
jgi:lysozyme family protein